MQLEMQERHVRLAGIVFLNRRITLSPSLFLSLPLFPRPPDVPSAFLSPGLSGANPAEWLLSRYLLLCLSHRFFSVRGAHARAASFTSCTS